MLNSLIEKYKRLMFSLRFSVLSIFTTLFVLSMVALIAITYFRFTNSMSYFSVKLMDDVSQHVNDDILDEIDEVKAETKFAATLMQLGLIDPTNLLELNAITKTVMDTKAEIMLSMRSAFWGTEAGDFVISTQDVNGNIFSEMINRSGKIFPQNNIKEIKNSSYDPRNRPWYLQAKAAKKTIMTELMHNVYYETNFWGMIIATPGYSPTGKFLGVFALQIRADSLRKLIESLRVSAHGKIFIVTDDGKVIAYARYPQTKAVAIKDIPDPAVSWVAKSYEIYKENGQKKFFFRDQGKKYVANYNPIIKLGGHNWIIGIVAPESDFTSELVKTNYITVVLSLVILLLGIAIVSKLVSRVVRPLRKLANETERIKYFEIGDDIKIKSRVKEVAMLTDAINSMKRGLHSFEKYVPASLVRQIIEAGEDAHVGGAKKQIAILFSDISNFTTIAEHEDPAELMAHLCDYFDEISHVILEARGTIDKYIGDSVMAFWGAPLFEEESCQQAARAAIKCMKRIRKLNHHWIAKDIPPFVTRIGVHLGDAIIGNVGSSERLNYTAIGDAINIANRLENINKIYETSIMVSETVYQVLRDQFLLRKVDHVVLRGRAEAFNVYELLGEDRDDVDFDLDAYNLHYQKGFAAYQEKNWDVAIDFFQRCLQVYPADKVAVIFIERCKQFKLHPPSPYWHGEWKIS